MAKGLMKTESNYNPVRPLLIIDHVIAARYRDHLNHICYGLTDKRSDSLIVAPLNCGTAFANLSTISVVEFPTFNYPLFKKINRKKLYDSIEEFNPNVVHCFSSKRLALAERICAKFNLPLVINYQFVSGKQIKKLKVSKCTKIIVNSLLDEKKAKANRPDMSDSIIQIHPGAFSENKYLCFSNKTRVPGLVVCSELDKAQNFTPMLHAIRHLAIDGFEFALVIIGTGKAENLLRKAIRSLGLSSFVSIVPEIAAKREIFQEADIFIQCKSLERLDSNLLEAMGAGMAVAVAKTEEGLLKDRETAFFFDNADEIDIYTTLKKMLNNTDRTRSIASNGLEHVSKNYSVSSMVDAIFEVYNSAIRCQQETTN